MKMTIYSLDLVFRTVNWQIKVNFKASEILTLILVIDIKGGFSLTCEICHSSQWKLSNNWLSIRVLHIAYVLSCMKNIGKVLLDF